MNRAMVAIVSCVALNGCAVKSVAVGDDGHYVITKTSAWTGKMTIWDCHSIPPGTKEWTPTCRRTEVERNSSGM